MGRCLSTYVALLPLPSRRAKYLGPSHLGGYESCVGGAQLLTVGKSEMVGL